MQATFENIQSNPVVNQFSFDNNIMGYYKLIQMNNGQWYKFLNWGYFFHNGKPVLVNPKNFS